MGIRESVRKFLAGKPPEATVPKGEVGYASASFIYQGKDFTKYNPDILYSYKGAQVYDKMMTDDQVKAVMEFKQGAVVSRGYFFDVEKDEESGEPVEEQQNMADFFDCVLRKMDGSVTDKLIEILSAMKYGFSVSEKIFQPIDHEGSTYWGLKDIKLRPFSSMLTGMVVDQHGNLQSIKQRAGGSTDIELPLEKIIHFVHRPEIDRHYGESDLRAAYRAWWSKDIAIKFQNIHLERHAGGFIWAQIDPAKGALSNTDKINLEKVLENLSAHTAIHVPSAVTLNTIQPLNTEAYDKAIAQYDKAISKSLLVPNLLGLSEQGSVGSYSQSSTQLEIFFWVLDLIAARLEDVLNEQLFRPLAEWNFGTDDYPRFTFELMSEDRKRTIMAAWSDLVSKGAVTKTTSDEDYIRTLIGFPEKGEPDAPKPAPVFGMPGQTPQEPPPEDAEDEDAEPVEKPDNNEYLSQQPEDKKKAAKKAFAERPWLNRVNFASVEKIMGSADTALASALAAIMAKVRLSVEDQVIKIGGERSWGNVKPAEIIDIKIPKSLMTSFRKELRASFSDTIDRAYEGARKELPKKMFAKVKPGMDKTQTEKFLASKAMKITGIVENRVLDQVQLILENSIKYDKALKDVIKAMEDDADFMALLPKVDAAGRAVNVPARLENIARTNIADAVNQSRMALFTDPALKGFVEAFEYSAILDDRTTEICEKLHGKIEKDWGGYAPPNHFQCRSILIPVTQVDEWDGKEDKIPSGLQPMKGFA
jgi:SPP1 gp7 family putative phage head morphogenesis protein